MYNKISIASRAYLVGTFGYNAETYALNSSPVSKT